MSAERTFLGHHVEAVRQAEPSLECPIRLARCVLERIGVELSDAEFTQFAADLARGAGMLVRADSELEAVV